MKIRVQIVLEPDDEDGDDHTPLLHEVAHFERGALQIDTLGLQLAEAKDLLQRVQEVAVEKQVRHCLAMQGAHDKSGAVAWAVRGAWRSSPAQCVVGPECWHLWIGLGAEQQSGAPNLSCARPSRVPDGDAAMVVARADEPVGLTDPSGAHQQGPLVEPRPEPGRSSVRTHWVRNDIIVKVTP
jgi:hypothetical protein